LNFQTDFDRLVEVRFDPARAVRPVSHEAFCLAGPWNAPHVLAQTTVPSGETRTLSAGVEAGTYRLRALRGQSATLRAGVDGASTAAFTILRGVPHPMEVAVGAGPLAVSVANTGPEETVVLLERAEWLDTVATGALVGTMAQFRRQFSAEVLAPGLEVRVQRLAFLFTDLAGSTALYERAGDAPACRLVQDHFRILEDAVTAHRGALVKTIGDAVMAVFASGADALEAAVVMQRDIRGLDCRGLVDPERLVRVGVHEGPCVAVTFNERLDYFGTTLNLAARIEHECQGGEVVASATVVEDREAAGRLQALPVAVEPYEARLRGISEPVRLYRLRPCWDGATVAPAPQPAGLPTT
jgi:class 3 adenylate cyclase